MLAGSGADNAEPENTPASFARLHSMETKGFQESTWTSIGPDQKLLSARNPSLFCQVPIIKWK